ncbi:MAG: caspase family protein, partial [Deltaproteobacteria bacterium]
MSSRSWSTPMSAGRRQARSPLRARLAVASLAAGLGLLAATGCATTRAAIALPPRPLPDQTVPDDLELTPTALVKSIPLNAYVRVQVGGSGSFDEDPLGLREATWSLPFLYFLAMAESRRSDDVVTLNYNEHFRRAAGAFLAQIFPNSTQDEKSAAGADAELRVEVKLSKTTYARAARELRQYVTLRILGKQGTVIFQAVASTTVIGDPVADHDLIYRALDENLRILARKIADSRPQILANIEFQREEFGVVQRILLADAQRFGRSPSQNSFANGQEYAVIIGVSHYQSGRIPDLLSPAKDARDLFATINDPDNAFNFQDDHVVLLLDEAATLRNIRTALSRWLLQRVGDGDSVLIYFAGH